MAPNSFDPVPTFLDNFRRAAESAPDPVLERLSVVWIWLNKFPEAPEHEFLVVETVDSKDGKQRFFIFDRLLNTSEPVIKKQDAIGPDRSYLGNMQEIFQGLRTPSPLPLKEERTRTRTPTSASTPTPTPTTPTPTPTTPTPTSMPTSTPTLHPPQLLRPQIPLLDVFTLSAAETSHAISDSLHSRDQMSALDQVYGDLFIQRRRFGCGRNARQVRPRDMGFFEFLVLAVVVHDFAPQYSPLEKNCFWFCNVIMDAVVAIFHLDETKGDNERENKYDFDLASGDISGRRNGWKIHRTSQTEISDIVTRFLDKHSNLLTAVNFFYF
jgi:hypothetical protein